MSRSRSLLLLSTLIPLTTLLAACGADDIASPGTGGDVIINPPAPTPPAPPPPPPSPTKVTAAAGCPTIADPQGLTDSGTIEGPTGTWRVCTLPARINKSIQLTKVAGLVYRLGGRVDVGTDGGPTASAADTNVTLTIDPGVIVFGGTGVSWLAVNRGNKIQAVGTATQPIIFTSRDNILGLTTDNSSGQWGGVVLLGRAPITDCENPGAAPGTVACERQTEGAADPAKYGGATANDSSGRISYAQIRYSGFVLSNNSELQSLTTSGTGSGTQLDHIMSFNSSDDGAEFFGGVVNMKYFVSIGAEDDNLDTDTGVKGNFQYVLAVQRNGLGDAMIEADSDNAVDGNTPRQNVRVSNATFIQRSSTGSDLAAILLRGGTDYTLVNSVLVSSGLSCLRISRANTIQAADPAQDEAGPPVFRSVQMTCGTPKYLGANSVTDAQVASIFGSGSNNNNDAYVSTLTSIFVNGATETAVPAFDASSIASFFDKTTYIGAVKDASDTWYKGWTCNSATADLGGGGLCTTIPTT
ncbi:hypothetical protein [Sphingosinicella sp. BN140058]|uniref:hypothetical protein n=1 Tax=Sphingosinicella sp. BN140058 TaxID=1892855 RepID=UPI001011DD5E|nr:hypothetical protein [Sphingosinicella sp. BN140058]QAY78556.1 hypothetical protein ETR14_19920 [Sphingosinicella sp. BN140058]